MFYSQFILAKKGPLGTIWIAAHLERKLRKNQVADTDIGVSVDSILFPEVPIALRLSSHLLLGVVRIYSRKVNYLFHDCSEALLKIKQAFRSTAVDLPPEESTAPYHSITLPETFDLDGFELPDSAFLQGNFVDHHVSTREQITLQDTMDATMYSTSQFGLDERFGDGDASQIGLDLDEDLFLEKVSSPQNASVPIDSDENAVHRSQPPTPFTNMDIDDDQNEYNEDKNAESPKDLPELPASDCGKHMLSNLQDSERNDDPFQHGYNIQTPDLNEVVFPDEHMEGPSAVPNHIAVTCPFNEVIPQELIECAQAPSTPGLMEEAIPANFQEIPASSPQGKTSPSNYVEVIIPDTSHIPCLEFDCPDALTDNGPIHAIKMDPELANIAQAVSSPTSTFTEPKPVSPAPQCSGLILAAPDEAHLECGQKSADNLENSSVCNEVNDLSVADRMHDKAEAIAPKAAILDGLASPSCSLEASNLSPLRDKSLVDVESVVITSNLPSSNGLLLAGTPHINNNLLEDNAEISILSNQDRVGDDNLGPSSNTSAPSSDCYLRSCSLQLNQSNILSQEILVENAPEFSLREVGLSTSEALGREDGLRIGGSSGEVQGENPTDTDLEVHQISETKAAGVISKENMLESLNYYSNSEFPEREKMLLAPIGNIDVPNDLGQSTAEKVIESDGCVDKLKSLCGKKRRLMESTPVLQNGSSAKMSGMTRHRKNTDYIPDDDDLLASILVGRTPLLKMKPTPPPSKVVKRPRLKPRVGVPKRKVLLDDTMILHADVIRQQLISTEDIRRIRKKAPCTRPEIWMIQKCSLEDEIFSESIFTGISAELNALHIRTYDLNETPDSFIDENHPLVEVSKERELSSRSDYVRGINEEEMGEPIAAIPGEVDGVSQEPSGAFLSIETRQSEDAIICNVQERIDSLPYQPQLETCTTATIEMNVCDNRDAVVLNHAVNMEGEMHVLSGPHYGNECEILTGSKIQATSTQDASPEKDELCMLPEQRSINKLVQPSNELGEMMEKSLHLTESASAEDFASAEDGATNKADNIVLAIVNEDTLVRAEDACIAQDASIMEESRDENIGPTITLNYPEDCHVHVAKSENDETFVSVLDSSLLGVGAGLPTDSLTAIGDANSSIPDMTIESGELTDLATCIGNQSMDETREGMSDVAVEGEFLVGKVLDDERNPTSENIFAEEPQEASSCPLQLNSEMEIAPSTVGSNPGLPELDLESGMDVESIPVGLASATESSDFCGAIDGTDTEFLNVDDEADLDEEADYDMPNPEESQSLENSGWSSRTRGVARYLKSLFDDESGHGRKLVAMDHLLAGKTRKEASRMFFETLVLKTRDYIHVEQKNPMDCIVIKPGVKLLKSEF